MKAKLKEILLKNKPIRTVKDKIKFSKFYAYDKKQFISNYSKSKNNIDSIDFDLLRISHAIEKGMGHKTPRPFGKEKIKELICLLKEERQKNNKNYKNNTAVINTINVLRSYVSFYEKKNWINEKEYKDVKEFLKTNTDIKQISSDVQIIDIEDIVKSGSIDYEAFLKSRHSIREFSSKKISKSDFRKAIEIASLSPSACNRQMCKAYLIQEDLLRKKVITYGQGFGGFEKETIQPIIITFNISANHNVGERNQGWFNAGLFSMNLVNAMHSIGIGSCFCQFGNSPQEEDSLKNLIGIQENERIAVIIAAGYYKKNNTVLASNRKTIDELSAII